VRVGTSKGSKISHMATVHPLATGSPAERRRNMKRNILTIKQNTSGSRSG